MHHVDGKMFKTIHNLYANAKSCVRLGHAKSESFVSNVGFRQGDISVLFKLSKFCRDSGNIHMYSRVHMQIKFTSHLLLLQNFTYYASKRLFPF